MGFQLLEAIAIEQTAWRQIVQNGLFQYKESLAQQNETKRQRRKAQTEGEGRETDPQQTTPAPSMGETVTPKSAWAVTPDTILVLVIVLDAKLPPRARIDSVLRMTDAQIIINIKPLSQYTKTSYPQPVCFKMFF